MENILHAPAIPLRGLIPIPNNEQRIEIGRLMSLKALEVLDNELDSEDVILLLQKDPSIAEPKPKDFEEYAVLATRKSQIKLPTGNIKVKFKIIKRVEVLSYLKTDEYFEVTYKEVETVNGDLDEQSALVKLVIKTVLESDSQTFSNHQDLMKMVQTEIEPELLCDLVSFNLKGNEMRKIRYIKDNNLNNRLRFILEDIEYERFIGDLENKINNDVKKAIDESQKEYYLREKMRAIQEELGDKAVKEKDVEKMRKAIKKAQMPKEIEEKVLNELQRYSVSPQGMAETGVIKGYIDFMTELPWHKASVDNTDLKVVKEKLDLDHYGLEEVKERIIEYLAVKIMTNKNPQTILCLAGPPGVGKTTLAMSIANALGRKFVKQSFGGVKDEAEIRGHRRTYVAAMPGRILKGMHTAGTINPVFLIDEIDKLSSDYKGDPSSAMLEVLDPEQNSHFSDHYVEEPYDLSQVLFIATANYLENVPAPLRDRMEIVSLDSYTEHEKYNIAKKHLIPKQLDIHGITSDKCEFSDEAIYFIIRHYTMEAGVRELSRMVASIIRKTVKDILINKIEKVYVDEAKVEEYLGVKKFTHNEMEKTDQVGVVTGLAYTQFGGDTLEIEVTYYKGKGGLVLTGKLGEVMKESASIALSYIKANASEYNIDPKLFEENDIHIHVPEGAVPKDGPSAGVTLATAILSCLTNKKVRCDLGMTGEITLRGNVLPIGGLREKSIAALRSGLKEILIPKENHKDIEDLPEEVKSKLIINEVSHVKEVFSKAFR
ncbi:MAG: endopeptidase La [Acholeplasmatales bacterium]|nr:endopeptidase La [Acholeplasmatales bacterium]